MGTRLTSKVSEKGQVTIPKKLREELGMLPGTVIDLQVDDKGRIIAVKVDSPESATRVDEE